GDEKKTVLAAPRAPHLVRMALSSPVPANLPPEQNGRLHSPGPTAGPLPHWRRRNRPDGLAAPPRCRNSRTALPYPLPPLHSSLAPAARTASISVRAMVNRRNP